MNLSPVTKFYNRLRAGGVLYNARALGINMTPAGVKVDHDVALTYHAVWAAVRCIAETLGVLNMHVFKNLSSGGTERRDDLVVNKLLRRKPNTYMTAMTFREVLTGHALTYGNGYAEIERDMANRPAALWPLLPNRIRPVLDANYQLWYEYQDSKGEKYYMPKEDILHLKGFGFDGLMGYDVISYFANVVGHALAVETFSSSYFGNGTHLSGGLFSKRRLSPETKNALRTEFLSAYAGPRKAFRMGVFEEGMEWKPFGLSPEASKLIESRQVGVEDVARIFRVPQHKIGHLLRSTNNNIEHQGIEFVVDTILPWATRWEQEADLKLLSPAMQTDHYTKLNVATLMRGDMKSRYDAYKIGREWGWLNGNQIAELEDLEPLGPEGDVYIVPMNFQPLKNLLNPTPPSSGGSSPAEPEVLPAPSNIARTSREELNKAMNRVMRREYAVMKEIFKAEDPKPGLSSFEDSHATYTVSTLEPVLKVYWAALVGEKNFPSRTLESWCQNLAATRANLWKGQDARDNHLEVAKQLTDQLVTLITAKAAENIPS